MPSLATDQCCDLCGLPARRPVHSDPSGEAHIFCCSGCRNVWQILAESGQIGDGSDPRSSPLFQQAQRLGLLGASNDPQQDNAPSDEGSVQFAREGSTIDDTRQCMLRIDGMWCSSCAWLIEQTLAKQKGVLSARVSFTSDTAR